MKLDLTGRRIAITGASSGIGQATAMACVEAGASVALSARRGDRLEALVEQLELGGGTAVAIPSDLTIESEARRFIEATHERLGGLDALVNNAGLMVLAPFLEADPDDWRRMIDVNVYAVLYCTRAALSIMRETGSGHIVNISSVSGRIAGPLHTVYSLTKFGLNGFTEALRKEVEELGIRVTIIEPGVVDTELIGHNSDQVQAFAKELFANVEQLTPEDIAAAIVFTLAQPPRVVVNELLVRPMRQPF
jgi:NADP-dependent 3-hydroxy acid dehydrogenase YdfG